MTALQLALMSALAIGCLFIALTPVSAAKTPNVAESSASSNQPPIANAGGVYRGSAGGPVQFNGTASSDPDGTIANYAWNFGDNTSISSPKHEAPSHSYANEGTYTVTLTVTDDQGATASATTTAIIGGAAPIVGEAAEPIRLSLSLNGSGAYAEVPNTETFNKLNTFTAEAWIKPNSTTNQQGVIERYNWSENDDGGFALRLIPGGKALFGTVRNANEYAFVTGATSLTPEAWHHVAGVFDGNELRVYVDGDLDGTRASNLQPAAGKASLKIGARGDDASNTFDGLIDDAKLSQGVAYKGSFKPEKRLLPGGMTDANDPAIAWGVWTFDDKQTIDLSGANNNLELKEGAEFSEEVNDYSPSTGNAPNSTAVQLNFDNLYPGTVVDDLYAQNQKIRFRSTDGYSVKVFYGPNGGDAPHTPPHTISRGNNYGYNHSVNLIVEFTQPVNNLLFYVTSCDEVGIIAQVDVYQNNNYSGTLPVYGGGNTHPPIPLNFGTANIPNVTKVVVSNIRDINGLSFDSFSYTYEPAPPPTPTPIPTPVPTLPPAPNSLGATGDEEAVSLRWNPPSANITRYFVKRATGGTANAPTNFITIAELPANTTTYLETGLMPEQAYTYAISATNNVGESPNSIPATAVTLAKLGCRNTTIPRPSSQTYQWNWLGSNGDGWKVNMEVSDSDGIVLRDIYLNTRFVADRISIPYFRVDAYKDGGQAALTRGELKPSSNDSTMRSRLTKFRTETEPNHHFTIRAYYEVDRIPSVPNACLEIEQEYTFFKSKEDSEKLAADGRCEPSGDVTDCTRFHPVVKYKFVGGQGEHLKSINIPQRHTYFIDRLVGGVSAHRDSDEDPGEHPINTGLDGFTFRANPIFTERKYEVIRQGGRDTGKIDNIHLSNKGYIDEPYFSLLPAPPGGEGRIRAGCPACVHLHWRWGRFLNFPNISHRGRLLNNPFSSQSIDIAFALLRPGEEDPWDYYDIVRQGEVINRKESVRMPPYFIIKRDVYYPQRFAFWYSPHGFQEQDTFFYERAWLKASKPPDAASLTEQLPNVQDGPVSIRFGQVFENGTTSITTDQPPFPLPDGYVALNNTAYMIRTTGSVDGPHIITFRAQSITTQEDFNKLQIFRAERDPFDPSRGQWADMTILPPETPAPNFSNREISSRSDNLGMFVIAKLEYTPPSPGNANLALTMSDSIDPVPGGTASFSYLIGVRNNGPQPATNVRLRDTLDGELLFVSATTSQGTCAEEPEEDIYCGLGTIAPNQTVNVTVTVKPNEGAVSFEPEGILTANRAYVRSDQQDSDGSNDQVEETTRLMPNPNKAPEVKITSPEQLSLLAGPNANVTINARATDSDGSVSRVEFFVDGVSRGNGVSSANNIYSLTVSNLGFGEHSLKAAVTDNGGRKNFSERVTITVNGLANVSMTSPLNNAVIAPESNLTLTASASHPSGTITRVEFFVNGYVAGVGTLAGNNQYNFVWNSVSRGIYAVEAVATDDQGVKTKSSSIIVKASAPPTVSITAPANNATFPSSSNIQIRVTAQDSDGNVEKVDIYANGSLIGTTSLIGPGPYGITWRNVPDGIYSIVAIATDNADVSTTSTPINITVNRPSPAPGEIVWLDDALPPGATGYASNNDVWQWVNSNPAPILGNAAHQSKLAPGTHQHNFSGATLKLPVNAGDTLYTYIFIDPDHPPREIMLQWDDGTPCVRRAFWGEDLIGNGYNPTGCDVRRRMGPLPGAEGQWIRLTVPAAQVGLEGKLISGMGFLLFDGSVTWDRAGKFSAPPTTTLGPEVVWVDDALPTGAVPSVEDDCWCWETNNSAPRGTKIHRTFSDNQTNRYRFHSFTGATPFEIRSGDVLFTYVYIDPTAIPDTISLEWYDGVSWNHRAFWGQHHSQHGGLVGTENRRYMGGLPPAGQWVRLEVPASHVGLEGKAISGMSFGVHREAGGARRVAWDYAGKSSYAQTTVPPLHASTALYRFYKETSGPKRYRLSTVNLDYNETPQGIKGYIFPNQAAGTVPFYRFIENVPNNPTKYFYSPNRNVNPSLWTYEGVEGYVYPNNTEAPGVVPLHLYERNGNGYRDGYFYTIDRVGDGNSIPGMNYIGISCSVLKEPSAAPKAPTNLKLTASGGNQSGPGTILRWYDNSLNESEFQLERAPDLDANFVLFNTLAPNVTTSGPGSPMDQNLYRVRAVNAEGASAYSNVVYVGDGAGGSPNTPQVNTPPSVEILQPASNALAGTNFSLLANAFDTDGAGSILRVEFFEGSVKLGEVSHGPYLFYWRDVTPGAHTVTAKVTDNTGNTTVSSPVSFAVYDFR